MKSSLDIIWEFDIFLRWAAESTRYLIIFLIQSAFQESLYRSPSFFEGLIVTSCQHGDGMSESDLEAVENASRKGIRKSIRENQAQNQK